MASFCGIRAAGAVSDHHRHPATQVDRAVKTLLRKVIQGKVTKEWKARQYFVRPAQQRVLDAKESRQRLAKKRFKAMMAAIAARQARYALGSMQSL